MRNLRNTITIRLSDDDYDKFIEHTGRNYSTTLRKLIQHYNERVTAADMNLLPADRIVEVMKR